MPCTKRSISPQITNTTHFCRRFRDDETGGITILTLVLLVTMLAVGGMAVDFMRSESNRIYLQGVADRAVISGASLTQKIGGDEIVEDFFIKNDVDTTIIGIPEFTDSGNSKTVTVEATDQIPTYFLRLIGIDELNTVAAASATEGVGKVEISLVVDVSLSMKNGGSGGPITPTNLDGGRIGDLRVAAQEFANIVLDPTLAGQVSLNIVPFAGQTNPGPWVFEHLGGVLDEDNEIQIPYDAILPGTTVPVTTLQVQQSRLVLEHYDIEVLTTTDTTPIPLSDSAGNPIFLNNNTRMTNQDITRYKGFLPHTHKPKIGHPNGPQINLPSGEFIAADPVTGVIQVKYTASNTCLELDDPTDWTTSGPPASGQQAVPHFATYDIEAWQLSTGVRGWGWCPDEDTSIKYGLTNPTDAAAYIAGLTLYGGTGTDYAMKWGLATLDPAMRPIFAGLNAAGIDVPDAYANRPADYTDSETQKILVLMTDGAVTPQFRPDSAPDGTKAENDVRLLLNISPANVDDADSWIGRVLADVNGRLSVKTREDAQDDLEAICQLAKDNGVEVFAVAFEYQQSAVEDEKVMRDCASPDTAGRTYYYATSGADLKTVFEEIAQQVSQLRLTR